MTVKETEIINTFLYSIVSPYKSLENPSRRLYIYNKGHFSNFPLLITILIV